MLIFFPEQMCINWPWPRHLAPFYQLSLARATHRPGGGGARRTRVTSTLHRATAQPLLLLQFLNQDNNETRSDWCCCCAGCCCCPKNAIKFACRFKKEVLRRKKRFLIINRFEMPKSKEKRFENLDGKGYRGHLYKSVYPYIRPHVLNKNIAHSLSTCHSSKHVYNMSSVNISCITGCNA